MQWHRRHTINISVKLLKRIHLIFFQRQTRLIFLSSNSHILYMFGFQLHMCYMFRQRQNDKLIWTRLQVVRTVGFNLMKSSKHCIQVQFLLLKSKAKMSFDVAHFCFHTCWHDSFWKQSDFVLFLIWDNKGGISVTKVSFIEAGFSN